MTTRKILTSAIIIFLLALAGMGLWLYEIVEIKTWHSLSWLDGRLYSPFIATLFSVFAFVTPFFINRQLTIKKSIIPVVIFYAANIICFQTGKQLCYVTCSKWWWFSRTYIIADIISMPLMALGLYIFLGLLYRLTTHKFIKRNKKINALFITMLLLLAIPLSLLTIEINTGFGYGTGWVDVVKMGYPIFWTTMLLGFAGLVIARQPDLTTDKTR